MPPAPLHCTQRATRLSLIPLVARLFVYSPAPTPGPLHICIAAAGPPWWDKEEEWELEVSVETGQERQQKN